MGEYKPKIHADGFCVCIKKMTLPDPWAMLQLDPPLQKISDDDDGDDNDDASEEDDFVDIKGRKKWAGRICQTGLFSSSFGIPWWRYRITRSKYSVNYLSFPNSNWKCIP